MKYITACKNITNQFDPLVRKRNWSAKKTDKNCLGILLSSSSKNTKISLFYVDLSGHAREFCKPKVVNDGANYRPWLSSRTSWNTSISQASGEIRESRSGTLCPPAAGLLRVCLEKGASTMTDDIVLIDFHFSCQTDLPRVTREARKILARQSPRDCHENKFARMYPWTLLLQYHFPAITHKFWPVKQACLLRYQCMLPFTKNKSK